MRIAGVQFLRRGNLLNNATSGAVIRIASIEADERLDANRLADWLGCIPTTLRLASDELNGPLAAVVPKLLFALSEQARLHPQPARLLHQGDSDLVLWLPVDSRQAAESVAELVSHIVASVRLARSPDETTAQLWRALHASYWNQTHAHLARAAQLLGIPFYQVQRGREQFLQLGQGHRLRLCHETLTDRTPLFARAATNKESLHDLLQRRGVPLPRQMSADSLEQALAAAEQIGWPVVLKPASGGKGQGVWVGLTGPEALRQAWQSNCGRSQKRQLVQQSLSGEDHRLLLINGELLAVAQRQPAVLFSDGEHPLGEQIAALNADPERGVGYERLKNRVPMDQRLILLLEQQGWTLDSIPPPGTRVQLSRAANLSQGGGAIDCSERVHPDNRLLAEDIARLIGSDVLGLDLISHDISVSWREGGTWLLEANLSAGLRPHLVANPQDDLCQRIVRRWVGEGPRAGRIPTALITGSVGKTTTTRLLAHLLHTSGLRTGMTSSTGMELDGQLISQGDLAGGGSALHLLQDRRVEAMVAEIARGGLLKMGLGLEQVDVGAVLNVLDNHVGIDGISSRQDLARIKSLVPQVSTGLLVLNADDPLVMAMGTGRDPANLALVSEEPGSAVWQLHRQAGHTAVLFGQGREDQVSLFHGDQRQLSIPLRDIPASQDGAIGTIACAAAFATAMATGLGLASDQILQGLRSFGLEDSHRYGRFEVLVHEPWRVVLAWADGPEAIASLSRYAMALSETRPARRVLLLSAVDNRPEVFLRQAGQAAWGFDLVITASSEERRGRHPYEVPALLAEGVRSLGAGGPEVVVAGVESEAVERLAELLRPGDLCVVSSWRTVEMRRRLLSTLRP